MNDSRSILGLRILDSLSFCFQGGECLGDNNGPLYLSFIIYIIYLTYHIIFAILGTFFLFLVCQSRQSSSPRPPPLNVKIHLTSSSKLVCELSPFSNRSTSLFFENRTPVESVSGILSLSGPRPCTSHRSRLTRSSHYLPVSFTSSTNVSRNIPKTLPKLKVTLTLRPETRHVPVLG